MDVLFCETTLPAPTSHQCRKLGVPPSRHSLPGEGDRGDIILPILLSMMAASFLFLGLFLLNKLYAHRTKEHLYDFQNRWNSFEQKYQK
jgi:hypothetical protein